MYTDYLSSGRRKNGCCQERLKLVETRLQIAFTHVVGSYANLFEQKKVFIWEKSRIPTGFLFWYPYMAGVSLFCTPIWRPWRLPKKTWSIPSHLESYLNRTLGRKRPIVKFWPCSREKLYKYRHPFAACDFLSEKRGAQLCTFDQAWSEITGGGEGLVKSKSNLSIIHRSSKLRVIFIPCVRVREVKSMRQWWALWGIFLSHLQ